MHAPCSGPRVRCDPRVCDGCGVRRSWHVTGTRTQMRSVRLTRLLGCEGCADSLGSQRAHQLLQARRLIVALKSPTERANQVVGPRAAVALVQLPPGDAPFAEPRDNCRGRRLGVWGLGGLHAGECASKHAANRAGHGDVVIARTRARLRVGWEEGPA